MRTSMSIRSFATAALLFLFAVASATEAGAAPRQAKSRRGGNAATIYKQAFALFGEGGIPAGMTSEEFDELMQLTEHGRIAPIDVDRVRALMVKVQPFLTALEPAGGMRQSDFDLDHSKGFDIRLPHLQQMRQASRFLRAQTALALNDSDWDAALASLRSWSSLGSHAGQDDILLSSLVGTAIARIEMPALDMLLDDGTLTQERAKALMEALRPLKGNDAFQYGDATRGEYQMLSSELAGKGGDEVAEMLNASGLDGAAVAGMSERDMRRGVERARDIYQRAAAAFDNPDPEAARLAIAELEREAEKNAVLRILMPAFSRALENKLEIAAEIAARLERIEAIADGTKTALEMANASTWLRRAAAIAASMPDEAQEAIEVVRFAGTAADPALLERATRTFLGAGRAIRDALARARACGTTDLDVPNDADFGLSMRWIPGLRGACRVLLAEATTLDAAGAADRALLVAGVARALVFDPSVTRSLAAQSIVDEAIPLFERVSKDPATDATARETLGRTLRELAASEGFRMAKGLEADRDRLSTGSPWGRVIDPARRKHVARRGAEFALFLQVAVAPNDRWSALPDPNASRAEVAAKESRKNEAPAAAPTAPSPGILVRADDLLPPEPTAEARALHEKVATNAFFRIVRSVPDSDDETKFPFKGITPVMIRTYGADLAKAAETAAKLSLMADQLER